MRKSRPRQVFVALGANLGDRLATLRSAAANLHRADSCAMVRSSSVYETRAIGPSCEPFLNAAVLIETSLSSGVVLRILRTIENAHGRTRDVHWGARTLDLDLLLARDDLGRWEQHKSEDLELPHPRILRRDFVLAPLLELDGDVRVGDVPLRTALDQLTPEERTISRVLDDDLPWVDPPSNRVTFPPRS